MISLRTQFLIAALVAAAAAVVWRHSNFLSGDNLPPKASGVAPSGIRQRKSESSNAVQGELTWETSRLPERELVHSTRIDVIYQGDDNSRIVIDPASLQMVRQSMDSNVIWTVNIRDWSQTLPAQMERCTGPVQAAKCENGKLYFGYGRRAWVTIDVETGELHYWGSD